MHIIVEMDPYETGEVRNVIGPFPSESEAKDARKAILKKGGHPDSDWVVMPIQSLNTTLDGIGSPEDD